MTDNEIIIKVFRMMRDADNECDTHATCGECKYCGSIICDFKHALNTYKYTPIEKCKMLLEDLDMMNDDDK